MQFHVVPLTDEQDKQLPPVSALLLKRTENSLLRGGAPIILFCDAIAGFYPGYERSKVYMLNDHAWTACQGLGLNETNVIQHSQLPARYGLLIGPQSALTERKFD